MKQFKKVFLAIALLVMFVNAGWGQTMAGWDVSTQSSYGTSPLSATTSNPNVTVGGLTKGSGVGNSGTAAGRAWGGTGWNYTTSSAAITANVFFTFTIKANTGYLLSLNAIDPFDYRRSGTGATTGLIQYQINSGLFTDITTVSFSSSSSSGASLGPISLSGVSALQNLPSTSTVTFRIIPYGASGSTGTWYIFDKANTTANDFAVTGTVTSISSSTYTWNATGTGNWTTASNWTPARNAPGLGDKLIFNNGQTLTITNIPTQTISQIEVSGNTIVNLQAGTAANTLTMQGGTGVDLNVTSGSQLNITGVNSLFVSLQSGVTGSISGNMTFTNADHRLSASNASAITFNSGSVFTAGSGVNGNVFGSSGTNNSVIFSNGAVYVQIGGANPFGNTTSDNIVTFQTGSLYKLQSSIFPSLTNRVYANFEYDYSGIVTNTMSGSLAWTFDNLIISQGTFNANVSIPVNCKGNISVANSSTFGYNPENASDFSFSGSSLQTISGAGTVNFGDKVNLKVNNANGLVLQKDLTVNGSLTFISGILSTGSNYLDFSSSVTFYPVETNTNYILGKARLSNKTVGTDALNFMGAYIHSGTDNIGNVTITRITGSAYTFGSNQGINCSWNIVPTNQPTNGRLLDLSWFSAFDNGKNFSSTNKAQVWKSTDNGANWTDVGVLADVSANNPRSITNINTTSFSIWSVSDKDAPLPVTISSLNTKSVGRNVFLNWTTSSETNNIGFDVERAEVKNGTLEFKKLNFVNGMGTVNTPTNYTFEDINLQTGKYKYRLRQVDVNGNFEYFVLNSEVEIGVPKKFNLSQNYPNPFNPVTKINYDLPEAGKVDLRIYDMLGKEMAVLVNEFKSTGYHTVTFNASELSSGIYFYRINALKYSSIKKMAVIK